MNKSIYEFDKGDEIVRIEPALPVRAGEMGDRSYIGLKLIFIGIANGCAYLQRAGKFDHKYFGDKLIELPLDLWSVGWDYYFDPELFLKDDVTAHMSAEQLQIQIDTAIENEDYELAARLTSKIKNTKNEDDGTLE